MTASVRVLGLDPSIAAYGWALVDLSRARPFEDPGDLAISTPRTSIRVIDAGCWRTSSDARARHRYQADVAAARVERIAEQLATAIRQLRPDRIVAEAATGTQSVKAAQALARSFALTLAVATTLGRSVRLVQPHEVKREVGGSLVASKDDVADGVERLASWRSSAHTVAEREAEADAVAVALVLRRELLGELVEVERFDERTDP